MTTDEPSSPDAKRLLRRDTLKMSVLVGAAVSIASFGVLNNLCHRNASSSPACYRIISTLAPVDLQAAACLPVRVALATLLEWLAVFLLAVYFATLVYDIWPAYRLRQRLDFDRTTERKTGCQYAHNA